MSKIDPTKNREYQRRWYHHNRDQRILEVANRRREITQWVRDIKSSQGCGRCGENHPAALDFHHPDGKGKDRRIADMVHRGWGRKRLLTEIEKCDILCANCHRKEHYQRSKLV